MTISTELNSFFLLPFLKVVHLLNMQWWKLRVCFLLMLNGLNRKKLTRGLQSL